MKKLPVIAKWAEVATLEASIKSGALSRVEPNYTEKARKLKISGTVQLSLIVDETGYPRQIQVLEPLGEGLDENAVAAVQTWKFSPGISDGKPTRSPSRIEVSFRIL